MLDVLCDATLNRINDLIEEINIALNDNVRDINLYNNNGQDELFSFTTYDGTVYYVKGSNTRTYIITKGNNEDVVPVEERDRKIIIGDKGGIYFETYPYPTMTDTREFTGTVSISKRYIRAAESYVNGHVLRMTNYDSEGEQFVDYFIYKINGLEIGKTYTFTFYVDRGDMNAAGTDGPHLYVLKTADGGTGSTNRYCQINLATGATTDTGCSGTTIVYQEDSHYYFKNGLYTMQFTAEDDEAYLYFDYSAIVTSVDDTETMEVEGLLFNGMELGVLSSKIYYGNKWYDYAGSGGGGSSDVELIEISKADYDALPQSAKDDPNKAYFVYNYPSGSAGSGGASALVDLSDVDISNPSNGQVLKYNGTTHSWENAAESGGGSYPAEGAVKWDSTDGHLYSYQSGSWVELTLTAQQFIPTSVRVVTTSTSPSGAAVAYGDPDAATSTYTTVVFTSVQTTPLNVENIFTIAYPSPWKIKSLIDGLKFTNNTTGVEQILNTGDEITWTYNTSIDYTLSNV